MAATIIDVAREAGVSIATVSRVINRTGTVKDETRLRVEDAIQRLGYRPNPLARTLPGGQPDRAIGLVIPEIHNPVFPEIAQAVEHEARRQGYQVLLCQTDDQWAIEVSYTKLLIDRKVAGIIFVSGSFSHVRGIWEGYELVKTAGIPYVFVNSRAHDTSEVPTLASDEGEAGALQAMFLLERGHRHLLFFGGSRGYYVTRDRLAGIESTLRAFGEPIRLDKKLGSFRAEQAHRAAREALAQRPLPTAVICASDLLALVLMKEARNLGLRVPEDLSIIGFDGIQLGEYAWPPLTTVAQPLRQMGVWAVRTVLGDTYKGSLRVTVVDRGSVQPLCSGVKGAIT